MSHEKDIVKYSLTTWDDVKNDEFDGIHFLSPVVVCIPRILTFLKNELRMFPANWLFQ